MVHQLKGPSRPRHLPCESTRGVFRLSERARRVSVRPWASWAGGVVSKGGGAPCGEDAAVSAAAVCFASPGRVKLS